MAEDSEGLGGKAITMQTLILQRGIDPGISHQEPEGTPGILDEFKTLELPWRQNVPDISRILAGTYLCTVTYSPHLGENTYELQGVPSRSDVRIHQGNWAGDKAYGWYSDVEGCILIGNGYLRMAPGDKKTGMYSEPQFAVVASRSAFTSFMQKMGGQPFQLQIVDPVIAS